MGTTSRGSYELIANDSIEPIDDAPNTAPAVLNTTHNEIISIASQQPHKKGTMKKNWDKFKLLMWKNFKLQFRAPAQTALEILVPVIFTVLIVILRNNISPIHHDTQIYKPFSNLSQLSRMTGARANVASQFPLLYTPSTKNTDQVMEIFSTMGGNVTPCHNLEELVKTYKLNEDRIYAAIQFPDNFDINQENIELSIRFPSELRYKTESLDPNTWKTNLRYPIFQMPGPRSYKDETGASPYYQKEGFLFTQQLLTLSILANRKNVDLSASKDMITLLKNIVGTHKLPILQMQRFPYPEWNEDKLYAALFSLCGLIFMLSFAYSFICTIKSITVEKEKQLKEAMKIMGLPNWLHWTAWFVKTFIILLISCILMVILLKASIFSGSQQTLFSHGNAAVIMLFLITYVCAIITFSFAITVFFSKANTAASVAGILWILSYAPYMYLERKYDQLSLAVKVASCLGPNAAMGFGFQLILRFEGTGEGIQWRNLYKPVTPDDNLTLGLVMGMLIVDAVIFLIIALYVEGIFPGDYGVVLPWYFPFTASFWCGQPRYTGTEDFQPIEQTDEEFFEKDPESLKAGVEIRNLKKVYKPNVAVSNLSLKMYENQITVLLGHNGAGKTTTMSMLTGMCPPTSGTALISGYDIRNDMPRVRESLGFCPQHNILFDNLTVKEHLYFFTKLKGLDEDEIDDEIDKYITMLELEPKRNVKSSKLSGGMKRKLSVGIAFCGNSKVVMLDEPSAGMDPSARRALWTLIENQRNGRTIILTTHYMDEADILGDRIAIMVMGELRCCGSTFFLKKKYGDGYHLVLDKSPECEVKDVTEFLQKYVPDIKIESNIGSELTYSLDKENLPVFEAMLEDLENNYAKLGILSFGISLTTLEEVFLKVADDQGKDKEKLEKLSRRLSRIESQSHYKILGGTLLMRNQIHAMFLKKMLSSLRSWIVVLVQILIPVIFLINTLVVAKTAGPTNELPSLPLNLAKFKSPTTLVKYNNGDNEYVIAYQDSLSRESKLAKCEDVTQKVLEMRRKEPTAFKYEYIIGAEFAEMGGNVIITAFFNNDALHSPAISNGFALNAVYRVLSNCSTCSITFNNYPLPYNTETEFQLLSKSNSTGFQIAFNTGFAMAFAAALFILFIIRERVSQSKHLQLVSGVNVFIFWLITFICDYAIFIVMTGAIIITLICFQIDGYSTGHELGRIIVIMLVFGFSVIPLMYVAGFFFKIPTEGFTRMSFISIFGGVVALIVVQIMKAEKFGMENVADGIHWGFLIYPHYSMINGLLDTYNLHQKNKICNKISQIHNSNNNQYFEKFCSDSGDIYFRWNYPGIGRNLTFSVVLGIILLIVIAIFEMKICSNFIITRKEPQETEDEDSDVLEEKEKMKNLSEINIPEEYVFVMKNVTKYYEKGFLAVNGLYLGAKRHECFGLLGVNGAGKTSVFKMMSGDVRITYGEAWIKGYSVKRQLKQVQQHIGYCPQFDALLDNLTPKETLIMYALLRGISHTDLRTVVKNMAIEFDFKKHLNKKVRQLSGGNKRKLSTAIAFIGNPTVVYLDEPTAGMDPATKRFVWNAICKFRDSGKLIILTSHNMEECEALCTRIAIMVNGNFKCLGSSQHLKTKFAKGFTLTVKVKKSDDVEPELATRQVEEFIETTFPSAILKEKHIQLLSYYITDTDIPWSKMFGILEQAKSIEDSNIEDYSVGQSSLEQVFLTFIKEQR